MRTEKCCHIYEHKCCRFSDENLRFIALWTIQKFCSRTPCGMARNRRAHHCRGARRSPTGRERSIFRRSSWILSARIACNDIWHDRSRCS